MSGKRKNKSEGGNESVKRPAKRVKKQGSLRPMHEMPLDIVYEIFGHLESYYLLRLARTGKKLRELLMTRSS
ncbi:hypothetical protein PQX77_006131, partial [Marasmius sp. AFHP31]